MKSLELHLRQEMLRSITGLEYVYLAGGCVRDTLYGVIPKDYDAIVIGYECIVEVFHKMKEISSALSQIGIKSEVYQAYGVADGRELPPGSFSECFLGCMKIHLTYYGMPIEVDLLFSVKDTIGEHIKLHDCNANMVYLDDDGNIIGERVSKLEFRDGIDPERVRYMTEKWNLLQTYELLEKSNALDKCSDKTCLGFGCCE